MFFGDAVPRAAGLSNPSESCFLELGELLRIEASPIEWAGVGCGSVFAETVGTFDDVVLGVSLDGGLVCATFVVTGAGVAPGRLGRAGMG